MSEPLTLALPDQLIEQIAQRAAAIALQELGRRESASPYLTIPEAAAYARCKRQRIDDLLSARRLRRYKDGRRTLIIRAELDVYLAGQTPSPRGTEPAFETDWNGPATRATVTRPGNRTCQ